MRAFVVFIVLAAVIGGLYAIGSGSQRNGSSAPSNEIAMTADMKTALGAAIRSAGFNCPEPKLAFGKGVDAYGAASKVWCGPAGVEGSYENAVFRVTIRPNKTLMIEPWRE